MSHPTRSTRSRICPLAGLALCIGALLAAGCASGPRIGSETNRDVTLPARGTYALLPLPNTIENADPGLALRMAGPVREEIHAGMERLGHTETDLESADIVLNVRARIVPKVDVIDYGYGYGGYHRWGRYYGYAPTGGVSVDQYDEGTVTIEAFENETRTLAWVGWAEGRVRGELDEERLRASIASILERFPPGAPEGAAAP